MQQKISIFFVLILFSLILSSCKGNTEKYPVGETYQPATNHSSWTKQNQKPRFSGAHGRFVTVYANDSANQVKQHGGTYQPGAIILKETFRDSDPAAPVEQMFAMEKGAAGSAPKSNDWIWIVTDKSGKILQSGEDAVLNGNRCARCHAGS
ncbi:MAG TPA: cytochrome P460 family protein [Blastocatellia bacterium]|nr:cytochrome P460 family protein [Blastocatellia bacterium]